MKKHKGRLTIKWTNWTFGFWWDPKKLRAWGIDFGPVEYVYAFKPKYVAAFDPGRSTSGYGLFQVMTSQHVSPGVVHIFDTAVLQEMMSKIEPKDTNLKSYLTVNPETLERVKKWTDSE